MRKWIWISLAGLALAATGFAIGVKPFVRGQILSRAAARGLSLQVGSLSLGYPRVTLRDVRIGLRDVPGVQVSLHEVDVTVGLGAPRLRGVEVRGGSVRLEGDLGRLSSDLEKFREKYSSPPAKSGEKAAGPGRREVAKDVRFSWKMEEGRSVDVHGLQYERLPGSPRRIGADLVRLSSEGTDLSLAGALVEFAKDDRTLARVSVSEARLLWRLGVAAPGQAGGHLVDAKKGGSAPAADTSPSSSSGKAGGLSDLLAVHPARARSLRALLSTARQKLVPRLPAKTGIERLFVEVSSGEDKISIGPSRLSAEKRDGALHFGLFPGERSKGTPLELEARFPLSDAKSPVTLRMAGGPVSLASLGAKDGDFGLENVGTALLGVEANVSLSADAEQVDAEGMAFFENLALSQPKLADDTIYVPRLSVRGQSEMRVDGSRYRLTGAEIRLNGTRFEGEFSVERVDVEKGRARVVLEGRLAAPLVSCEQLSESAPRALLGPVADLRYAGTFSLDARVKADTSELSKMEVGVDFRNGCKITQTPVELDPMQFKGPFSREVLGVGGLPMQVRLGPGSDNWVSMEDISPLMEAALLVTEDGRFYRHEGFDVRAIESAIRDNTRAGRFVRGASTISMQLAKNLFLSREKTLSRKFQEAALTMLLEQTFEKRELLELYLNVIEFGPGIYGIGPAAAHYFGTVPADLSAAQAFFLASILPAPGISYFDEQGQLSAARKKQVRYLLGVSHERGRLTDEQLEAALAEELQFGVPAAQSEGEVQDRGVHAIPSEEGQPLAFPSDAASGGRRRAGARERDPGRVSPQLASPRQRPEKRRPSREKGVGDSAP